MKGSGYLENILMDTNSVKYNRPFNPYIACTQVNTYHSEKQENKMPDQHNKGISGDQNITDG